MKKTYKLVFGLCIFFMMFCSCQTSGSYKSQSDAYCFFCSKDQEPVAGYSVFCEEKFIAVSNTQGFVRIPFECVDKELIAKKSEWETVCFNASQFRNGTVLCISVRPFNELCTEAVGMLKRGDVQSAERLIEKMNGEQSVIQVLKAVSAYKRGDTKSACAQLSELDCDDKTVKEFALLLNGGCADETKE